MRLKELRGRKTQVEIAEMLGIPQTSYSNYENGKTEPNITMLIKIADCFNVSLDYLCERKYEGNYLNFSERKRTAIEMFDKLSDNKTEKAIIYIQGLLDGDN